MPWGIDYGITQLKQAKQKGIDGLIEVENPNRMPKKLLKAKDIDINAKVELSRRERSEHIYKHFFSRHYTNLLTERS